MMKLTTRRIVAAVAVGSLAFGGIFSGALAANAADVNTTPKFKMSISADTELISADKTPVKVTINVENTGGDLYNDQKAELRLDSWYNGAAIVPDLASVTSPEGIGEASGFTIVDGAPVWNGVIPSGKSASFSYTGVYDITSDGNRNPDASATIQLRTAEDILVTWEGQYLNIDVLNAIAITKDSKRVELDVPVSPTEPNLRAAGKMAGIEYTVTFTNNGVLPQDIRYRDTVSGVLDDGVLVKEPTSASPEFKWRWYVEMGEQTGDFQFDMNIQPGETITVTYTIGLAAVTAGDAILNNCIANVPAQVHRQAQAFAAPEGEDVCVTSDLYPTPVKPVVTQSEKCGVEGSIALPETEGIAYTRSTPDNKGLVVVTAAAKAGYDLKPDAVTTWEFFFGNVEDYDGNNYDNVTFIAPAEACPLTEVVPVAPKLVVADKCGAEDTILITEVAGITYHQDRVENKVAVVAVANEGFQIPLTETASWVFELKKSTDCEVVVPPTEEPKPTPTVDPKPSVEPTVAPTVEPVEDIAVEKTGALANTGANISMGVGGLVILLAGTALMMFSRRKASHTTK